MKPASKARLFFGKKRNLIFRFQNLGKLLCQDFFFEKSFSILKVVTPVFAMDRCIYIGSSTLQLEWRFASVDTKARKVVAGTHLEEVGSSCGGGGFFVCKVGL